MTRTPNGRVIGLAGAYQGTEKDYFSQALRIEPKQRMPKKAPDDNGRLLNVDIEPRYRIPVERKVAREEISIARQRGRFLQAEQQRHDVVVTDPLVT